MLTGHLPFQGPTPIDYIMQHLNAPVPSLAESSLVLPGALDLIIRQATAKNPLERYPDVPTLLQSLRRAVEAPATFEPEEIASAPADLALENPFKGLRPFGEADAEDFFGREILTQELLGRMAEEHDLARFLAVVGAHPFEEVEAALLRVAVNPPESLLGQLREDERGLLRAIRRILPADEAVELILVIDQFEEVFTLVEDEAVRTAFLDSLVTAVMDTRSRVRVIITMRADFIDRPLQHVDFGDLMRQRTELVIPLTPDELEPAITGPTHRARAALEPGLTARIIRELGDQPGALPLLQYALTELFERREGHRLTLAAYNDIGGVLGALGRRAEEIYTGLDELVPPENSIWLNDALVEAGYDSQLIIFDGVHLVPAELTIKMVLELTEE